MFRSRKAPSPVDDKEPKTEDGIPMHGEATTGDPQALEAALVHDARYGVTRRGLKSRHVQLIALGGAIGTGLFVGSGRPIPLVVRSRPDSLESLSG